MQLADTQIARIAGEVLETMAFVMIMPGETPVVDPAQPVVRASVRFRGPIAGQVALAAPANAVAELAATMGGDSQQPPGDALGELCNIVCGNLLPAMAGPQAVFDLQPPRVLQYPGPAAVPRSGAAARVRLPTLDSWFDVEVAQDAPA